MEKLKQVIAYIVKKRGRKIKEEDFVNVLSYDRNWISPSSARKLFQVCEDASLIAKKDDYYEPTFEIKGIQLPLDFMVEESDIDKYFVQEDIFTKILDYICSSLNIERRDALMEINSIKNEMKYITIEVAALIFCKENNLDCSKFYDDVEKKIKSM
jgi:hypothetical protein